MNKELTEAGNKYIYLKESDEVAGPVRQQDTTISFAENLRKWNEHLGKLPRYKVTGTHSWSDQQVLEVENDFYFIDTGPEENCWVVAIPIKSDSKGDKQKELEQAAKEYADKKAGNKRDKYHDQHEWHWAYNNFIAGANWHSNQQTHTPSTIEQGQQGE